MNMTPLRIYSKHQLTKWLLATVLVLSLFSYAGVSSAGQEKSQIYHTALTVNSNPAVKKCVTYYRSFHQPYTANAFFDNLIYINRLSIIHSQSAKTRLIKHSAPYFITQASSFLHRKVITDTAADFPAILV